MRRAFLAAVAEGVLPAAELDAPAIPLTIPEPAFGDFATSLPLSLGKTLRRPPREIAEAIVARIDLAAAGIASAEVAGAGFINLRMAPVFWHRLAAGMAGGEGLAIPRRGEGHKVQVEFVSANPTGPLHIGHARNAAIGDVVANLLTETGFTVEREYYLNDHGTQMNTLGLSTFIRYRDLLGRPTPLPEDAYRGEYIKDVAAVAVQRWGERYLDAPVEDATAPFRDLAGEVILDGIREDLERFGVGFDVWFKESTLHDGGLVEKALADARDKGLVFEKEGAVWFDTERFGDDRNRVVVRSTGEKTYFAADIAYLLHKYDRGFSWIIDVWGKDHHGYVPRMRAAVRAFGHPDESFDVILVTLVNLIRGGQLASMSTRTGEFLTLREIMDEVGVDAARYFLLRRRSDSPLDFDLDLAVKQSQENPVYYLQYLHARITGILGKAAEAGIVIPGPDADISALTEPEEFAIVRHLASFPEMAADAALHLEPHRLTFYLEELAGLFHPYYNRHRVITDDPAVTIARLFLARLVDTVAVKGMRLLGVSTPDRM